VGAGGAAHFVRFISLDAARGTGDGAGEAPPQGGNSSNPDGQGAIDDENRGLVSGGTTITGGGAGAQTNGEVQITYKALGPPKPTNLSVISSSTEDELTISWDDVGAAGYFVYRAQSSGSTVSDYTQVADVTAPPYTDTGLEDGEQFYYRVSSHD
jgi:hypothetical protein